MQSTAALLRLLSFGVLIFAISGLVIAFTVGRNCIRSASEASIADEIRNIPPAFNMTAFQLMKEYSRAYDFSNATYNGTVGIVEGRTGIYENENYFSLYEGTHWRVRCFASDGEINKVESLDSPRVAEAPKLTSLGSLQGTLLSSLSKAGSKE